MEVLLWIGGKIVLGLSASYIRFFSSGLVKRGVYFCISVFFYLYFQREGWVGWLRVGQAEVCLCICIRGGIRL